MLKEKNFYQFWKKFFYKTKSGLIPDFYFIIFSIEKISIFCYNN